MSTIKVKTGHGKVEIEATVVGKFAYHPNTSFPQNEFTVTHVATGQAITDAPNRKAARELAQRLDEAVTVDIAPERIYSEEYKAFARAVRSVIGKDGAAQEGAQ